MAFDQSTRNRLQRFVTDARRTLEEEFTRQLQNDYGLDPISGTASTLESLRHINDQQRETARILRDTLAHYCASAETDTKVGLDRIVREQAFTVLNRLAALRMAEARGLLMESVGNGYQAKGFQLYARLAGTGLGETGDAYRVYLQSVFDELSQDLPGLFDRFSPQGRLSPREAALIHVLTLINHGEIEPLWAEDETIGWIYQYFNSKEERKAMRDASQAPRNSRELAVRNQFFTPRYVVEFLVDNTLGRLWFNWTGGQTGLRDRCQYLLVKPDEQPEPAKRLRDPRTIKLLDPACGSMHFGLYAFDLFLEIYREAWAWEQTHGPGCLDTETGGSADLKPLSQTYADEDAFLHDVPRLIIEHNIYGVDIDPRAAQIASLALWLRAQRAWHEAGVTAKDRPQVGRGHVVAAVAPPAEVDLRKRFMEELDPLDAELFEKTLFLLKGLPELGMLLQVEKELPALVRAVFGEHGDLFRKEDMESWQKAEVRLREALSEFAHTARSTYQGRLFAEDALQGLRMIDHCGLKYDAVVMNPPFGLPTPSTKALLSSSYAETWKDIYAAFVERALSIMLPSGRLGAITPNMWLYSRQLRHLRLQLLDRKAPDLLAELGGGVMDDAAVEAAVWTAPANVSEQEMLSLDLTGIDKAKRALSIQNAGLWRSHTADEFARIENSPYCHHMPKELLSLWRREQRLENEATIAAGNTTFDDFRFVRLWWEVPAKNRNWITFRSGSDFQPYYSSTSLKINWKKNGGSMRSFAEKKHGSDAQVMQSSNYWHKAGLAYPRVATLGVGIRVAHPGEIFSGSAGFIYPKNSNDQLVFAAFLNSSIAQALFKAHGRYRKTETIAFKDLPVTPSDLQEVANEIGPLALDAIKSIISWEERDEISRNFLSANLSVIDAQKLDKEVYASVTQSTDLIDSFIVKALNLDARFFEKPDAYSWSPKRKREAVVFRMVSYAVGLSFGRFYPIDGGAASEQNTIERIACPLPELSPAMQVKVGAVAEILADDGALRLDLASRIDEWLSALGVEVDFDIRSWLNKNFFSLHLQHYSQNRRKAPIYWPISTSSGSYTLWLYYPSLTDQTLFTAVNNFIEPKLKQVGQDVAALRIKGSARSRDDEKNFEALQALDLELIELRDTLLQIAQTYRPNYDDGVQITAAPLWQLFRHKPWQKILKDTWAKLEKGDYDWAHLAMAYWPDRVREKCETDKSLAIAHDLEQLYVEPEPTKARGRKKDG